MSATYYVIDKTDGTRILSLLPGEYNGPFAAATSISDIHLFGAGHASWGEGVDENAYRLLENFACEESTINPGFPKTAAEIGVADAGVNHPVIGQLWFNKTTSAMYVYDGATWVIVSGLTAAYISGNYVAKSGNTIGSPTAGTMTGPLVIDGSTATAFAAATLRSDGSPTLRIESLLAGSNPPIIWMVNPDNAGFVHTTISPRDTSVLSIRSHSVDNIADAGTEYLSIAQNGVLTAPLCDLVDITANKHLATKEYVDANVTSVSGSYVHKIGDTMTGELSVEGPGTNGFVRIGVTAPGNNSPYLNIGNVSSAASGSTRLPQVNFYSSGNGIGVIDSRITATGGSATALTGDLNFFGNVILDRDPTVAMQAMTMGFAEATYLKKSGDTTTGTIHFTNSNTIIANASSGLANLEARGTGGAAFMSFYRDASHAAYLGLDSDNQFKVGGSSLFGGVSHKLWHAGNDGHTSGLDADTLDGHHASDFTSIDVVNARSTGAIYRSNFTQTVRLRNTELPGVYNQFVDVSPAWAVTFTTPAATDPATRFAIRATSIIPLNMNSDQAANIQTKTTMFFKMLLIRNSDNFVTELGTDSMDGAQISLSITTKSIMRYVYEYALPNTTYTIKIQVYNPGGGGEADGYYINTLQVKPGTSSGDVAFLRSMVYARLLVEV